MPRIVHISDLHFGTEHPDLLAPLRQAIDAAQADVVAVSGDLTQRARRHQFRAARAFLDSLAPPWISVPGNHDVPLDKLWDRLLRPYGRYREIIGEDLCPVRQVGPVTLVGLNTVDPRSWQRGRIGRRAVRRACATLAEAGGIGVVVAHHPFDQLPDADKTLMRHAAAAAGALAECGAQVILTGHLHRWRADPFVTRQQDRHLLQVQVGTSLSRRVRGQPNDFAVLDFDDAGVEVRRMTWKTPAFATTDLRRFNRIGPEWRRA
ncbi:metallophosphoesterase family protein [Tropicimonas sediminicola]|uniref:3',5'-cyclic AMP phosphodiesterase CpdA n=1 Tax=Tropicimonas sediminicola TaxID=1031541 RepID=A0A239M0V4_9RHOB|nr:metallophosphoesterase [Tropicimonas sediminicola]SNT35539.1 3',5'-cyclic AMP phosphodiesterase CpdA [Tropicimonas sediminicola]